MMRSALRVTRMALLAAPIVVTIMDRFVDVGSVVGVSMQPALNPRHEDGRDLVLLDKFSILSRHQYHRGDVVMLMTPDDQPHYTIKRIIALEGDVVRTRPHCRHRHVVVPRGHCWIEGDNWEVSHDSNQYGPVPLALIEARVAAIVWPPQRIRWINGTSTADRCERGTAITADVDL